MEKTDCCLCGSKKKIKIWSIKDDRFLSRLKIKDRIKFYVCQNCGLGYSDPRLTVEEIQRLYTTSYREEDVSTHYLETKEKYSRERIKFFRSHFPNMSGKVLEIGSSEGTLLKFLRDDEGWAVKGCEPFEMFARYGIKNWGIDTDLSFFESSNYKTSFDLVALMHVIEHIPNPVSFLKDISKVMNKNGIIFMETPNLAKPYKGRISHAMFSAPHLIIYSKHSISNLFAAAGFQILYVEEKLNMRVLGRFNGKQQAIQPISRKQLLSLILLYKKNFLIEKKIRFVQNAKKYLVNLGQKILPPETYRKMRNFIVNDKE